MYKLFRRSKNRIFAGLCGGLGEYTNMDPVLWRILFATMFIFTISGIGILYLIGWIFVPSEE
jgi:phage shock protein PspC (stress-responsive transcriptional regulator)